MRAVTDPSAHGIVTFDPSWVHGLTVRQIVYFQVRLWKANFWAMRQFPIGSRARDEYRDRMRLLRFYIWRELRK